MPYQVAATAWTHSIGCTTVDAESALRAFRNAFTDKGPEFIP